MVNEYNTLPKNANIIDRYNDFQDFFTFQFEEIEFRQPCYDENNTTLGLYDLKIFWIDKANGLGYGISKDWKNKNIINYKFGSEESWKEFTDFFASQQY